MLANLSIHSLTVAEPPHLRHPSRSRKHQWRAPADRCCLRGAHTCLYSVYPEASLCSPCLLLSPRWGRLGLRTYEGYCLWATQSKALSLKADKGCASRQWDDDGTEAQGLALVTLLPRANKEGCLSGSRLEPKSSVFPWLGNHVPTVLCSIPLVTFILCSLLFDI